MVIVKLVIIDKLSDEFLTVGHDVNAILRAYAWQDSQSTFFLCRFWKASHGFVFGLLTRPVHQTILSVCNGFIFGLASSDDFAIEANQVIGYFEERSLNPHGSADFSELISGPSGAIKLPLGPFDALGVSNG